MKTGILFSSRRHVQNADSKTNVFSPVLQHARSRKLLILPRTLMDFVYFIVVNKVKKGTFNVIGIFKYIIFNQIVHIS